MGDGKDDDDTESRFMTESEVADVLRRSTSAIKRLRLSGQLAYLPLRPVLIDRADLEAYIQRQKDAAEAAAAAAIKAARPFSELSHAEQMRSARAWALKQKMRFPRGRRTPAELAEWRKKHPR